MRSLVIAGGTDGIGRALAMTYLDRGDTVLVIGRTAEKSKALVDAGAHFLEADLSLVSENARVIEEIKARFSVLDALVFCARHYRSARRETADGFEDNFALFYLSRFLLGRGLLELLEKAASPVIMNVAGPGAELAAVHWDDLGLENGYNGGTALTQGGKLNDLLGVAFASDSQHRTRYVLFHPGMTSTGFSGEYSSADEAHIEAMKKFGRPVAESAAPIIARLDAPPAEPLSAYVEGRRISVDGPSFDRAAARRLHQLTLGLLGQEPA
jgi:NAD(P)-dependent dehydrogenase (short-subunit alcohol dehydrogenase family)